MEQSPNDRRILLTENTQQRVWLDLDSGLEVTEVVELETPESARETDRADGTDSTLAPMLPVVLEWIRSGALAYRQVAPHRVLIPIRTNVVELHLALDVYEETRVLRACVSLPLVVPESKRRSVCEALMRLTTQAGHAPILMNPDTGSVFSIVIQQVGDQPLTPDIVHRVCASVASQSEPAFIALAQLVAGKTRMSDVVSVARELASAA